MLTGNKTLARSTKLQHPSGITIETPFLVPSFSSKGFGFSREGESEIGQIFDIASEYLFETMLVSAYDLNHGHLKQIENSITELTIVDSGGYEISNFQDFSTVFKQPIENKEWSVNDLKSRFDVWPEHIPAIFVSYDHPNQRICISEQIESARSLFSDYKTQLSCLLIKPENENTKYVNIKSIISNIDDLVAFDVIGLTEKELGPSILERMQNIAEIRLKMDDSGLKGTPIHVFGSLEPLTSVLYFISGAEIFDGLTWLRYSYFNGSASYQQNYGVRFVGIERKDDFIRATAIRDNLNYLSMMKNQMSKFLLAGDFAMFVENKDILADSWDLLRTKVARLNHGR